MMKMTFEEYLRSCDVCDQCFEDCTLCYEFDLRNVCERKDGESDD